jgi:hypothetical protein
MVRILLPPAESLRTIGPSAAASHRSTAGRENGRPVFSGSARGACRCRRDRSASRRSWSPRSPSRCRCCCRPRCRRHPCLWLTTETECLCHRRTTLGISRGGERMIAPQSPTLQVLVPTEPVPRAYVPSQRLAPIAAIQANHVILMNGSSH